jgi:hypothetical protein
MNYDELKTCECDKEIKKALYVTEIKKDLKNKMCFGCGCLTNSLCVEDSQFLDEQLQVLPEIYKDSLFKNKMGEVMVPTYFHDEKKGMLFLNGTKREDLKWYATPVKYLNKKEREEHGGKKYIFDTKNTQSFNPLDFLSALNFLNIK